MRKKDKRKIWLKEIKIKLKKEGFDAAINKIDLLVCNTKKKREEKKKLMNYLNHNKDRMSYPEYIKKGLLIGSGAIESAHRTVLQKRLKQSGQRWSNQGLKNIIGLRVLNKSGHWDLVKNKLSKVA